MSIFLTIALAITTLIIIRKIVALRRVVPTNQVHIVQRANGATSYGKDYGNGNTYYEFPAWMPIIGITKIALPISVFDIDLINYEAYDKDRLPFVVDVKAFFRIDNPNMAAARVFSFEELKGQLTDIVRGAVRSLLAKSDLESIMSERSTYGELFTKEVKDQLTAWGVTPVKNIELMDIRDTKESNVISNIMAKKKSLVEKESREEVAVNMKKANQAEIDADKEIALRQEDAKQEVGKRQAQVEREVGIAKEQAQQNIKEEAKLTAEKEMAVEKVKQVQLANITKEANIVKAEELRSVETIRAEAKKRVVILDAEGAKNAVELEADAALIAKQKEALGIEAEGKAVAVALKEKELASVTAQVTLAKEVGSNEGYQSYLISIRQVEATEKIGVEQAKNLGSADIKVIANAANVDEGLKSAREIFTPKGGTAMGGMLEALANTPKGKELLEKFLNKDNK